MISRWCKCPLQELYRIIKAEHVIIVFNIVLSQQIVHLLCLSTVIYVHVSPVIPRRQSVRLRLDILNCLGHIDLLVILSLIDRLICFGDGLRIPEVVSIVEGLQVIDMLHYFVVSFVFLL